MVEQTQTHPHPKPPPEGEGKGLENWTRICSVDEIPRLGARVVRQPVGPNIAIFRTAMDTYFALADRCPHKAGPLSQGIVYGERVACPLHNQSVDLATGCMVAPDTGEVQRFPVKVEAGAVYVDLPVIAAADRYAYG
jgi:nitrite reductase (NADH) small subunit